MRSRRECAPTFYDMISPFRPNHIGVFRVMDWCNYWGFADCFTDQPMVAKSIETNMVAKSIETNQILATIADMLLPATATEEE